MRDLLPMSRTPASPLPPTGVILPAGGSGQRLGGTPKQFRLLGDAPVLVQTARVFARHPGLAAVVVVAPEASVDDVRALLDQYEVEALVVAGGLSRAASVERGLEALPEHVETVLVHDAVRPFVSADLIARVLAAVRAHGAAAAATRVADTLRRAQADRFGPTVKRDGLWAMQTPQGAHRTLLARAYAFGHASRDGTPTDEAGLLGLAGIPVHVVEGDTRNIKVTTPGDWALAEALWPAWVA
ncbi:MAG TPA: 2-C-methyl-D-erythritol 4-phosphate cytidylyltransferase [Rubricoccaceae bacterium]|jgi:2-C-methyl-D-erythritol 4-phosphate cytidylyltransferase